MKTTLLTLIIAGIFSIPALSQQALWEGDDIISPEVHDDQTVTFRIFAPNAEEVLLVGDWLPSEDFMPGTIELEKEEDGLWSHTTTEMESDLYTYSFLVDGLRVNDPSNVHRVRDVATVFDMFIVPDGQGDLYSINEVEHGTVAKRWYYSPRNDKNRRITIYTPPGYEDNRNDYPVLYLLHGMGGDEEAWITLGRTAQILDNLIAKGETEPMIVVMPNGNVHQQAAPGESPEGLHKPVMRLPDTMEGSMEESFPDIIEFIEENYRVKAEKEGRAIAGLSMGGFHSLHISRYYPGTFNYVGLFSPAVMPDENVTSPIYSDFDETLTVQKESGFELYWIAIGKTDFLYEQVEEYRTRLERLEIPYEYHESEGGHTWKNWRNYLSQFTPKLFK